MSSASTSTAFSALYREHFAYVWAVLRRLGAPDAELEDLVQETFVVVHRRLGDFEGRSSVRTWLYGIALRVYWNDRRRRGSRPATSETSLRLIDDAGRHDPERLTAHRQANALLHRLLDNLDDDKRTVFVLSELEGLTAPAIAEMTGAPTRTVYSRLRAARDRFSADLRRMQVREANAFKARELLRRGARGDAPPPQAQRRVLAALAVSIPQLATPASAAAVGAWGLAQSAVVSVAIGSAALLGVAAGATALRSDPPAPASSPAIATSSQPTRAAVPLEVPAPRPPDVDPPPPEVQVPTTIRREQASSGPDPIAAELALMTQLRDALKANDSQRALALAREHAQRFSDGQFAQERRRSRVTALCQAGRTTDARAEAQRLGLPPPC